MVSFGSPLASPAFQQMRAYLILARDLPDRGTGVESTHGSNLEITTVDGSGQIHFLAPFDDPKPENETAGKLRAAFGCGPLNAWARRKNAEERTHRGADHLRIAPGGGRKESRRDLPGDG